MRFWFKFEKHRDAPSINIKTRIGPHVVQITDAIIFPLNEKLEAKPTVTFYNPYQETDMKRKENAVINCTFMRTNSKPKGFLDYLHLLAIEYLRWYHGYREEHVPPDQTFRFNGADNFSYDPKV